MQKIALTCPTSLNEVLQILADKPGTRPIAGGTDLLVQFHKEPHLEQLKANPVPVSHKNKKVNLVELSNVKELQGIEATNNHVEIGPCTTHAEIAIDAIINQYFPMLAQAVSQIGSPQIRNRGTIGGNIAHASPSADSVPPLMVLKTEIMLSSLNDERKILLKNFFRGPGETILNPDEIISKIILPLPRPNTVQFYRRIAARKVHACAKVSVAFCAVFENGILTDVRIALGAVAPTVILATEAAQILEGQKLTIALIEQAAQKAMIESNPIDDIRSTEEYRRAMLGELLRQELMKLFD